MKSSEAYGGDINDKVHLSNYRTKPDLINVKAKKIDLASLKSNVDKLDIDKLVPLAADLVKLSNVIKNDVIKKMYICYDKKY